MSSPAVRAGGPHGATPAWLKAAGLPLSYGVRPSAALALRLAQRVPIRIHLDGVPPDVRLVAGMTASVEIDPRPSAERQPPAAAIPGAAARR